MTIAPLPKDTIRKLGSTQALTDSASLVKELVDNALDARASAVFIEVSTNTLDIIQVKDNGHGIAPNDRQVVCQRYCTSKIGDLADLDGIGGASLGFRGEALASAAEMSGAFFLTTRVEGEAVAVKLNVDKRGGKFSQERVSHPAGTTVRVIDFLKDLPVRKQTALKGVPKTLTKIKRLLQGYALSRPSVRFSLKMLKAKNEKGNWMYAPKLGAELLDALTAVIDKPVAGQCQWHRWISSEISGNDPLASDPQTSHVSILGKSCITIEAVVPRLTSDISIINNIGQFVFIDSRAVSCARGTLKQIIDLYKTYFRSNRAANGTERVVDPFLYLNLVLPPNSYDVNIEPTKDDVLFCDQEVIIASVNAFLTRVYGALQQEVSLNATEKLQKPKQHGFELLLARKPDLPPVSKPGDMRPNADQADASGSEGILGNSGSCMSASMSGDVSKSDNRMHKAGSMSPQRPTSILNSEKPSSYLRRKELSIPQGSKWKKSMFNGVEQDSDDTLTNDAARSVHTDEPDLDDESDSNDITVSNPWTMAKMNAPIYRSPMHTNRDASEHVEHYLPTPVRQAGDIAEDFIIHGDKSVPNLQVNASDLPSPQKHKLSSSPSSDHDLSPGNYFPFPRRTRTKGLRQGETRKESIAAREKHGQGALDAWVQSPLQGPKSPHKHFNDAEPVSGLDSISHPSRSDFVSARDLVLGTPLKDIPDISRKVAPKQASPARAHQGLRKPFVSPMRDGLNIHPKKQLYNNPVRPTDADVFSQESARAAIAPIDNDIEEEKLFISPNRLASNRTIHPDLAITLDYEARKQTALQKHKENLRQQTRTPQSPKNHLPNHLLPIHATINSPYTNRYNAAVAALAEPYPRPEPQSRIFNDGDPRAYFLRVQRDSHKLKRRRTAQLPLESIAENSALHDLLFKIETTPERLNNQVMRIVKCDAYVASGEVNEAGLMCSEEGVARAWEAKLRELTKGMYRDEREREKEVGREVDLDVDLLKAVKGHLSIWA